MSYGLGEDKDGEKCKVGVGKEKGTGLLNFVHVGEEGKCASGREMSVMG